MTQTSTDSGMSSGLSNAQNEGIMYQGVNANIHLQVALPPRNETEGSITYQSGQSAAVHTDQEYSSGTSFHQSISSSRPDVSEVIP